MLTRAVSDLNKVWGVLFRWFLQESKELFAGESLCLSLMFLSPKAGMGPLQPVENLSTNPTNGGRGSSRNGPCDRWGHLSAGKGLLL